MTTDRTSDPSATTRSYEEKYDTFGSEPARASRASALGSELPNGYTTVDQARSIAERLELGPGVSLLDLGSGRGWPGSLIATESGCTLVAADLPILALVPAREALVEQGLSERSQVVCADGRRLPLGDSLFDAVCHADVLC